MNTFEMHNDGELRIILCMEVTRNREARTITLLQERYAHDLLKCFGYEGLRPILTPCLVNKRLVKHEAAEIDMQWY